MGDSGFSVNRTESRMKYLLPFHMSRFFVLLVIAICAAGAPGRAGDNPVPIAASVSRACPYRWG